MKKIHKVVMLTTKEKTKILKVWGTFPHHSFHYDPGIDTEKIYPNSQSYQHLYIISNEEIKEGDWMYSELSDPPTEQHKICKNFLSDHILYSQAQSCPNFKIIATDNPLLGLPDIPESFIKEFVSENGKIREVEVEYSLQNVFPTLAFYKPRKEMQPNINPDNTICVSIAKRESEPKPKWTREDFMEFIRSEEVSNTLSPDDCYEVFCSILYGSSDITVGNLNYIINDYGVEDVRAVSIGHEREAEIEAIIKDDEKAEAFILNLEEKIKSDDAKPERRGSDFLNAYLSNDRDAMLLAICGCSIETLLDENKNDNQ